MIMRREIRGTGERKQGIRRRDIRTKEEGDQRSGGGRPGIRGRKTRD